MDKTVNPCILNGFSPETCDCPCPFLGVGVSLFSFAPGVE